MKYLYVLLALVTAVQAKGSYVLMAPNTIRPGMNFRTMVHIFDGGKTTTLTINILRNGEIIDGTTKSIRRSLRPRLIQFQLPLTLEQGSFSMQAIGKGGVNFNLSKRINFVSKDKSVFIQSDKAIYKPGDRVQFRTLSLFPDLKPCTEGVNISVYDSDSNKIYQWQEARGYHGVVSKDFELSSHPVLGDWKIKVDAGKQSLEKTISIAEYVLPKFQVEAVMPSFALSKQKEVSVKVKATYTYGKGVLGRVNVAAKLLYNSQADDYENGQGNEFFNLTDTIEGEVTISITLPTDTYPNLDGYKLAVKAEVLESVTGNIMTGYGYVNIYGRDAFLKFPPINADTFKPGLRYIAYLTASQPDGNPLAILDDEVEVVISVRAVLEPEPSETEESGSGKIRIIPYQYPYPQYYTYTLERKKISVPGSGLAFFDFIPPSNSTSVTISASYRGQTVSHTCKQVHSPSNSFIQLSLAEYTTIKAGDDIGFKISSTMPLKTVIYHIISRGALTSVGHVYGHLQKEFSFSVRATYTMAPSARIIAYVIRDDSEMVVDSVGFDVSGAFQNYVDLNLSETEVEPGEEVRVHVTAEPLSQVFLLALDQSVLLLKSGNDITPRDVYDELKKYDTVSHSNDYYLRAPGGVFPGDVAARSFWWPYPIFYGGTDADRILSSAGVIFISDVLVYRHKEEVLPYPVYLQREAAFAAQDIGGGGGGLKSVDRIRTKFPETWIWTDIRTCASGQATVVAKVPDTITSWIASVFAVHKGFGFGIAPSTARLRVFKSFFVSLNLPYSVIRGEYVAIQAIVFNYLDQDQIVKVTMPKSYAYYSIHIDCNGVEDRVQVDQVHSFLVKAGQSKSMYFPIVPTMIGQIEIEVRAQSFMAADGVRRTLLVVAEGVAMEFNQAVLIDLTREHNTFNKSLKIDLPFDVVEGSTLAKISVIGDIMGPSISGLDKLLRLPTGCGEQTLLSLAPDVYITDYLEKTEQLTGAISDKALSFMEKGYQQELTFKHYDGSFSAFGKRDHSGSMWLTAFVARVFHQASSHIVIDEDVITGAITWIIGKQHKNGSFPEPGRVIHKNMQGRASSGTALTAFVLISLCENKERYEENTTEGIAFFEATAKALAYLEAEVAETDDLYLMALALYAFHLAESEQQTPLYNRLLQMATIEGGLKYWHVPAEPKERAGSWRYPNQASAIDTEVTSYILLTLALKRDLSDSRSILQWVTQQRNPIGGFSSTQDTVVALQALSEIAELVYSDTFHINVKVSFDEQTTYMFHINRQNALIKQRRQTLAIPSVVEISATGEGIALVEIAVFFNVLKGVEDTSYTLKTSVRGGTINHFELEVCTSRLGDGVFTGMVLAEIGILSGFDVDESKIAKLDFLKGVEKQDRKLILYFDEITSNETCVTIHVDRVQLVAKSRPAVIRIYDYYEPSYQVTGLYSYDMLDGVSICGVCKDCRGCASKEQENDGEAAPAAD